MNIVPIEKGNFPISSFRDGDQTIVYGYFNLNRYRKMFGYKDFLDGLERKIITTRTKITIFIGTQDDLREEVYEVIKVKDSLNYSLRCSYTLPVLVEPKNLLEGINWFIPKKEVGKVIKLDDYR